MIVDLGIPTIGTIEVVAHDALRALAVLRENTFRGVVAVSFEFNGTRVAAWPDDTVQSVFARWREERERETTHAITPAGYVGKRRKDDE